eukprot:98130_1
MLIHVFTIIYLLFVQKAAGWGWKTHDAIATIAENWLTPTSAKAVASILDNDPMHSVAAWADGYCHKVHWCSSMHYIDTPVGECGYNPNNDCPKGICVPHALANYTRRLIEGKYPNTAKSDPSVHRQDLAFATHFSMDMNQPLHCGQKKDRGGNSIKGIFFNKHMNLHQVWDDGLPEHKMRELDIHDGYNKFIDYMQKAVCEDIKSGAAKSWADGLSRVYNDYQKTYNRWTSEGAFLACKYAYRDQNAELIQNGFTLTEKYFEFAGPVCEEQVRKSVVRLAAVVNTIFDKNFGGLEDLLSQCE